MLYTNMSDDKTLYHSLKVVDAKWIGLNCENTESQKGPSVDVWPLRFNYSMDRIVIDATLIDAKLHSLVLYGGCYIPMWVMLRHYITHLKVVDAKWIGLNCDNTVSQKRG